MASDYDSEERTGEAFALVVAAAGATAVGSLAVYYPPLAKWATARVLGGALGFATGVMLYVSLVDIYNKSITGFQDQGHGEEHSFIFTTLSFFAGALLMKVIDVVIHKLTKENEYQIEMGMEAMVARNEREAAEAMLEQRRQQQESLRQPCEEGQEQENLIDPDDNGLSSHSHLVRNKSLAISHMSSTLSSTTSTLTTTTTPHVPKVKDALELIEHGFMTNRTEPTSVGSADNETPMTTVLDDNRNSLFSMGATTAAAIALHNFPEGLVTFVAYMEDPAVGVAMAIGIAVHNVPEGLCVAMPIYYATNSRMKAFLWGSFSGLSEPIGALFGWVVLKSSFSGDTYGIMFGLVAGMMVFICLDELLPMAFRFDPTGRLVTWTCFSGMFLVALSLMLFSI